MCIGFFAVNPSPGIQFILAFNRDEFLERHVLKPVTVGNC
jgi:uncharacterized protein with NRDE domain